mmetsp:Transcript_36614/g.118064  ORF Transcript_36614/g.118064 Transcript_36614/m.118064 type:complete len:202 (+) Transcript_36614:41-646(+)
MLFVRRLLLIALAQVAPVIGFGFTVEAGGKTCFDETVKSSERVSGDWRVLSGGILDLDVEVTSPSGEHVYSAEREAAGSFAFFATDSGTYVVCFSNARATQAARDVSAKITVGEQGDGVELAKAEQLAPLEDRVKRLHTSMISVRDLQDQQREQDEERYRVTSQTRRWLLWFTVLEAFVLVAVSLWQILYLKSFFEVKRVV